MNTITFDYLTFQNFKIEYENALKKEQSIFIFQGNEILTGYAKYVIEFLNSKFS